MLKKRFRLNTSGFNEVFNFGQTSRHDLFLLKRKENSLPYSRFAVAVSRKIAKKAVERKHIKRRMMHAIADKAQGLPKADYLFVLNSSAKDVEYSDLLGSLELIK